jgi:hypothetical protein
MRLHALVEVDEIAERLDTRGYPVSSVSCVDIARMTAALGQSAQVVCDLDLEVDAAAI